MDGWKEEKSVEVFNLFLELLTGLRELLHSASPQDKSNVKKMAAGYLRSFSKVFSLKISVKCIACCRSFHLYLYRSNMH